MKKLFLFMIPLLSVFNYSQTQENKFHDTQGKIEVNGGGQLNFSLPIALPPGIKSVAPQISLIYTNGLTNGIAGYGWDVSGISSISRLGRSIDKDGEVKGIKLDYSDYYSFNGQRLILKSGEYGKDGAEYVTEKYSNIKIKSIGSISSLNMIGEQGPASWEVTFEDGSKAWYGTHNPQTDQLIAQSRSPLDYNITKWQDAQGNVINYIYQQTGNVSEIKSISWGGNTTLSKPDFNEIVFNYGERNIKEQSYVNGGALTQTKILNSIEVKASGAQFKKYVIEYTGNNTNYQFVGKITEKNSLDQSANSIVFQNDSDTTTTNIFNQNSRYDDLLVNTYNLIKGDFNGDGKLDVIKRNTLMLSRLEGNGNFIDFPYEGEPLSSGNSLYNNILKQSQSLLTISYDRTIKKLTLQEYGLENNTSVLYKSTDFTSPLLANALYGNLYNPNRPPNSDQTYYNNYIADEETYEGNFNGFGYSQFVIRVKNVKNDKRFIPPREGGPKVTTTKSLYSEEYFYFDTVNNVVKRLDILDHHAKIMVSDFDGDSKTDILQITGSELKVYSFDKNNNLELKFTTSKESLDDKLYLGDFNGDGKTDILAPIADSSPEWRMYISTGTSFRKEYYPNLYMYQPSWQGPPRKNRNIQRTYTTSDLNKDGKSDMTIFESQVWYRDQVNEWNNPDSSYGFNYLRNEGVDSNGKPMFSSAYSINPKEATDSGNDEAEDINYSMYGEHYIPLFGNFRVAQLNNDFLIIHKTKLITWNIGNRLDKISRIRFVNQGGIQTEIQYANFIDSDANIYKPASSNFLAYPYINIPSNANFTVVSKLVQGQRWQDFRYKDLITHIQGKGMIGFKQMARSTFCANGMENSKIWNGSELNPTNEGLPFKDWSIRTNNEANIFPDDISLGNNQLLSFKQYDYKIDKLLHGVVVTTIADIDRANIVTSINPYITINKDFLKDIKTVHTVESYNSFYHPLKSIENINDGFAITTSEMDYYPADLTPGNNYSIGKPKTKITTIQAYGDIKSSKEEYVYENNLLKTLTQWNRNNSKFLQESYLYDGFGNITKKTITNNTDSNTNTTQDEYDPKGRFVVKKTDNLGLESNFLHNNWGQVTTQTDFLGNTIINIYDGWGKLLTTTSSLAGVTTYNYEKLSLNAGTKITVTAADNNEKITYTNPLGQVYKTSTKGFNAGEYVSVTYFYDVLGRKTQESEPYFEGQSPAQWNTMSYDDNYFPAKVKTTLFNGKEISTLVNGRTTITRELNGNQIETSKTVDALDNIISTTDKGGTVNFTYNAACEQITATYGTNVVTTQYDLWGRKSEFNDPSNGKYKYTYDGFGKIRFNISPKGFKQYDYNALGQLTTQTELSSDGDSTEKQINFTYDNYGRLTSKSGFSNGVPYNTTIEYDGHGRIKSNKEVSNGKSYNLENIAYDNQSRLSSYTKSLHSGGLTSSIAIVNIYNDWNGQLYKINDGLAISKTTLWQLQNVNAKGQITNARLGAADITNAYDGNGLLSGINHSSVVKPSILQLLYTFDAVKNELTSRTTGGDFSILENFTYDTNNRLISWTNPRTGQNSSNIYDTKGRITENDQLGIIKYENSNKIYQPSSIDLNAAGSQNYNGDLIQRIIYNENNDPVYINGIKGDVFFQYGLTSMRQKVDYGGNFDPYQNGKFTKFYSEDGTFEIVKDNVTGKEKHVIYIGSTPYESNIIFLKNYDESLGSYKFLHKDYLGSILAISDGIGNSLEQRHYDAWGNFTHLKIGNGGIITDKNIIDASSLLVERGYTGHEHFPEIGIIHMNGRLYDSLLRRFLNADENIQDPSNTQNYNKYAYVLNNPLLYNDPSGETFGIVESVVVAVAVAVFTSVATDYYLNRPVDFVNMGQSMAMAAISAMVSYGVGEIFRAGTQIAKALGETGTILARAGAHALTQGSLSYMQGGNFWSGALSGAFASASNDLLGYAAKNVESKNILRSDGFALFNGAISGGVGSVLGGGNFWVGAGQGLMVTAFNFLAHKEVTLLDEFSGTGLDPEACATYEDWKILVEKIETLKKMYSKLKSQFQRISNPDAAPGNYRADLNVILINDLKLGTLLNYAFTLGHEMYHHFDYSITFAHGEFFNTIGSSGPISQNVRSLYSEYRAYNWMKTKGYDINPMTMVKLYSTFLGEGGKASLTKFIDKFSILQARFSTQTPLK